jgi:chromate reductase
VRPLRLLGLVGSLRRGSLNRSLLAAIGENLPEGVSLETYDRLHELPIFDPHAGELPESAIALRDGIMGVDGLVIVTPE